MTANIPYAELEFQRMRQGGHPAASREVIAEEVHLRPAQEIKLVRDVFYAQGERAPFLEIIVRTQVEQRIALGVLVARPTDVDVATLERGETEPYIAWPGILPGGGAGELVRIDVRDAHVAIKRAIHGIRCFPSYLRIERAEL